MRVEREKIQGEGGERRYKVRVEREREREDTR